MEFTLFKRKQNCFSIEDELDAIYQTHLQARSFKAFCIHNEVFDVNKQKRMTNKNRLFKVYAYGIEKPVIIINKN